MKNTSRNFQYWGADLPYASRKRLVGIRLKPDQYYGMFMSATSDSGLCGYICEFKNETDTEDGTEKADNTTADIIALDPKQVKHSFRGEPRV